MTEHHLSPDAKRRRIRKILLRYGVAALCGVAVAAAIVWHDLRQDLVRGHHLKNMAHEAHEHGGAPVGDIGGPFALTDQDGNVVTDQDFRGKLMLVTFGYTYCPDVCPSRLQDMALAIDRLDPAQRALVQPVFITVDPDRDTPKALKDYVGLYDAPVVGLTGSPEQIAQVAKAYKAYYAKGEIVEDHDYVMDHTTLIYAMAADGTFITTFGDKAGPEEIAATLRAHLAEKSHESMREKEPVLPLDSESPRP